MKKSLFITLSIILSFQFLFITGCGKKERDPNTVSNYLKDLNSYSCKVDITVKNNKQVHTYKTNQFYSKAYGSRLEFEKERLYIYVDDKLYVKDFINGLSYNVDKNTDGIYRLSLIEEFVDLLYTNERIKYKFKKVDGKECQVIELIIPGNNRNISKAELYVNIKNSIPNKMYIYDSKNEERVEIVYKDFKSNIEVNKDLFDIKAMQ